MKLSLRQKQSLFAHESAKLILKAEELGYEVTHGNTYRSPQEAEWLGFKNSLHTEKLAIDLNLFKNGKYITNQVGHEELGKYWKALGPRFRWGGDLNKKDYNHYSLSPDGIRT